MVFLAVSVPILIFLIIPPLPLAVHMLPGKSTFSSFLVFWVSCVSCLTNERGLFLFGQDDLFENGYVTQDGPIRANLAFSDGCGRGALFHFIETRVYVAPIWGSQRYFSQNEAKFDNSVLRRRLWLCLDHIVLRSSLIWKHDVLFFFIKDSLTWVFYYLFCYLQWIAYYTQTFPQQFLEEMWIIWIEVLNATKLHKTLSKANAQG